MSEREVDFSAFGHWFSYGEVGISSQAIASHLSGHTGRGHSAPLAFRLMRRIIDGGTPCVDCDGTGNAESCPKCHGSGRRSGGRCRNRGCWHGHFQCHSCRGAGYVVAPLSGRVSA